MYKLCQADIYLGENCLYGTHNHDEDDLLYSDFIELRKLCDEHYDSFGREFNLEWKNKNFRISTLFSLKEKIYVIRRLPDGVPSLSDLGFHPIVIKQLLRKDLSGLLVISGAFASGKTTTGSAIVKERLTALGGVAVTIEDPPELPLEGQHGSGVCFQTVVNENNGDTFSFLTKMAARWSPDIIYLGEIRDEKTAVEAIKAASNGSLLVCTFHASGVVESIERLLLLSNMGSPDNTDFADLLSGCFAGVLHQSLQDVAGIGLNSPKTEFLFSNKENRSNITAIIKSKRIKQLGSEINLQLNRLMGGG